MAVICNTRISTRDFTYTKETQSFSAWASDFKGRRVLSRVYDDACDEGFVLVSHVSGKAMVFAKHADHHRDGELIAVEYRPIKPADRALVSHVTIFND